MNTWPGLLLAIVMLLANPVAAGAEPLTVGIVPYLTPKVLIGLFQPVRLHLEKSLGRPVEMYTAPDVKAFVRRTFKPDFDLIITAAHHARLAQIEGGYLPLARFSGPLHAAVAVASASPLQDLKDLKGRQIAITDRSILVNIVTLKQLADAGISEKELRLTPVNSQNTGLLTVSRGEADATIVAHFTLDQIPLEQRGGIRVLFQSEALPNVTLLAKPSLPAADLEAIRRALLALPETPEGRDFLRTSRFQGINPADDAFMKQMDAYLPETRRQLGQ